MKALLRYVKCNMHGVHYAVSIFIATAVLWFLVHRLAKSNPVWAISSMVVSIRKYIRQKFRYVMGSKNPGVLDPIVRPPGTVCRFATRKSGSISRKGYPPSSVRLRAAVRRV